MVSKTLLSILSIYNVMLILGHTKKKREGEHCNLYWHMLLLLYSSVCVCLCVCNMQFFHYKNLQTSPIASYSRRGVHRTGLSARKAVEQALHSERNNVRTTGRPEKKNRRTEEKDGGKMWRKREKECSRGSGRPRYIGTLAIFSSMHTSTGMSRMHSERCVPRACTAERGAGGETRDNEKCTRRDILLARPSYNCRVRTRSLSFSFFFCLSLLVSLMHPPPRPRLERGSSETASGLLNNSLCGLAERCVCTCIDAGYFAKLPALGAIPLVSRRRRRYFAAPSPPPFVPAS